MTSWFAAGGGIHSPHLVQLTSQLTGLSQYIRHGAETAKGAAIIAAAMHAEDNRLTNFSDTDVVRPH